MCQWLTLFFSYSNKASLLHSLLGIKVSAISIKCCSNTKLNCQIMGIELHYHILCPHARAAYITVKHLKLDAKLVFVDLFNGGTRTPEYLKLNPTHTVPTLVDNGFTLFESRAIVIYLAAKYGAGTGLYPVNDLQAKANIDKIIFFDVTSFFPALGKVFQPKFRSNQEPPQEALDELTDKANILETLLGDKKFFAGDNVTAADISLSVAVPFLKLFAPQFYSDKLQQWYKRLVAAAPAVGEANEEAEKGIEERIKKA